MENLNLLFNKLYFSELTKRGYPRGKVKELNDALFDVTFVPDRDYIDELQCDKFTLQVCYPGLLVGLGYSHGTGRDRDGDEITNGFSLDYVSGQPVIPGSTVKGVLRSHFKAHPEAIVELSEYQGNVSLLEQEIFDNGDIFFDAVIVEGNKDKRIIGPEFVTPHPDSVSNPVPISMIKVLPDVKFEFRFRLTEGKYFTKNKKLELFRELLTWFGIGAKTNVGFGILKKPDR